jgi:class 3 adenylate cyclase
VVGEGPFDLVFVPGMLNHLELLWEEGTEAQRFFSRLASFSRLILFDKRGTGLSDPDVGRPTLEQRMDDLRAVMDAAESERAAVIGYSEGGPMSILFATTYPERVSALVLAATTARFYPAPGYPCGERTASLIDVFARLVSESWGQGNSIELFAPNLAHSKSARANVARWERLAASPGAITAYLGLAPGIDVRAVLSAVRVPTLVVYRSDDLMCDACHARYLAEHIDGARLVERPGGNHILWADADVLADDIEDFLTGTKSDADLDRVLTTVLFTDIIRSTQRAGALGDRRWRGLLDRHDEVARRALDGYRGRLVKTTGDGLLATFDGPARAVRCASTIRDELKDLGLEIRAGVHTGEVERRGEDVGGIAVHIGQRIASLAAPGQVLVSGTVHDLVFGSGIEFQPKGSRALRGVPGRWRLFAVAS